MTNQSSALHERKSHNWLIAATLSVASKESPDGEITLSAIQMNAVIDTEQQFVTALDLGKGNQHLQMLFHKRYKPNPELVTVVDIFVHSVSYLGHMKSSTFNNLPKVQKEEEPLIDPTGTGLSALQEQEEG